MAKEYIEREGLQEAMKHVYQDSTCPMHIAAEVDQYITEAPAADVVEVVHGRWIKLDMCKGMEDFKCSVCQSECYVPTCMGEPMYAFCPNCGNPMDGEDGDGDGRA